MYVETLDRGHKVKRWPAIRIPSLQDEESIVFQVPPAGTHAATHACVVTLTQADAHRFEHAFRDHQVIAKIKLLRRILSEAGRPETARYILKGVRILAIQRDRQSQTSAVRFEFTSYSKSKPLPSEAARKALGS
jgi:hypothetical protein